MWRSIARTVLTWGIAVALASVAVYPAVCRLRAAASAQKRVDSLEPQAMRLAEAGKWLDTPVSMRVARLGPLLSSWETIGGCGAGGTGGQGVGVKWIGHDTTGGLFKAQLMGSLYTFSNGYNIISTAYITRDLDQGQKWTAGVIVPFLYKYYTGQFPGMAGGAVNISNAGLGDIFLALTGRFGPINATAVTATLGLPTGAHAAQYRGTTLNQDQQLGFGNFNGSLMVDQTVDETWGLIVLGGFVGHRGGCGYFAPAGSSSGPSLHCDGTNDLGSYRAPVGSLYTYAGYFLGPFVPSLGVQLIGFTGHDTSQGVEQTLPLYLFAANASIEWSNDDVAVLLGASFPFGLDTVTAAPGAGTNSSFFQLQPWVVALGVSVSPF
jgi:hypothetical protein